ncbi:MAG: sigma-70 family RNA polymerase sigma factor [Chitinophagales bacterium]
MDEAKNNLEPDKWVERYADALFAFAMARVRKQEVAEDLVQDTFFSAYKAKDSFLANASEKTWLISILKRKIIDHYRKKSTQNELSVLDKEEGNSFLNYFFTDGGGSDGHWSKNGAPAEWKKDFETSVETQDFQRVFQNCMDKLPEKWAAVFTLKNVDDMDSEEICKELDISPSNYWVIMHRAKLQLRGCLEKNWFNN